jgi:ATP-binding cassette subfamily B protein/subfamily B ATP-binding cassette protein MsbA
MGLRPQGSRQRFGRYRQDLKDHRTEGWKGTAKDHARKKPRSVQRTFFQLFKQFLGLLAGHRGKIILALTAVTLATVLNLAPPYAAKIVFDNVLGTVPIPAWITHLLVLPTDPAKLLTIVAMALIVVAIVSITVGMTGRWLATLATKRVQAELRKSVFEHAVRLPLHRVYEMKSGGTASILREDAGGVAELIFSMLYNPWRAIIRLVGTLAILTFIDWRLLVGSLLIIPTVFLTHRTWISRIRPLWRDIRASRQHIDAHATEAFGGMRIVRGFGRQRSETDRFTRNNHFMIRQEIMAWWWSRTIDIAWSIIIPTGSALLLWYGGTRILGDRALLAQGLITEAQALTVGDLVMFLMYLAWLLEPLATLAASATALQNQLAGLDRVLDLLGEPREMESQPGHLLVQPATCAGRITLANVTFTYPGTNRRVIDDVSLKVQPGETVALVGTSGAGKTTLCNLIARFYDPSDGLIELDGTDLRQIDVDSYRRLLGIVEQEIFLFDGTIAQNIGYGRRDGSMDDIVVAATQANAHEFIAQFERGYDTLIGERGVRLSGGQRQRLAIARALLADPRILILDEATSNLDTQSERLIQQSLETLMRGRTSFVIAHRLSTVTHADRIVVLDGGAIVEQGTHDALMAQSGRYERMVQLQFELGSTASPAPEDRQESILH